MTSRWILFIFLALSQGAWATQTFTSSPARTDLIELYTSEGCSSCPSAEQRLNNYANHKGLWTDFVPVAFHVDYWNYIGWTDRFSSMEFSVRQRTYSKEWKARTIYTPCFVVNGKPTRNPDLPRMPRQPGVLQVTVCDGKIEVRFTPTKPLGDKLTVWIAPLSGAMTTRVTAGENRGRTLQHCFVALALESKSLQLENNVYTVTCDIPAPPGTKGISVWITRSGSLTPIQATGGWLE